MNYTVDESVDFGIVEKLRQTGITVYSISEESLGVPDFEVLKIAYKRQSLLLTEDKDFGELVYRLKLNHRGILLIRLSDLPRTERILLVSDIIKHYSDKLHDSFSVLTKNGLRIKKTR